MEAGPREHDEDVRLVRAAQKGDADAFRRLIERHQDPVFDLCLRMLGNPQDAEDAAQDTFLAFFRHLRSYREDHKLSNWLYTIALNRCRRLLRKRKLLRLLSLDFSWGDENEPAALEAPSEEKLPEAGLEQAEAERWAAKVLASLPPTLREPFLLRHVKKMHYEEIAAAMKLSLANVKVRLHRAKLFLLKRFGPGPSGL
ncbi:MAG: sigma-70 family RNA polymerase sigma factor [Elusimicrobia bacterium]|nr:sigma-70 family RNA polymerase sigma factor [Elusimicrobiota bacterium]